MSLSDDIRRNRFHDFAVTVGDHRSVAVEQVNHEFYFGSNIFALVRGLADGTQEDYEAAIKKVWNFGTLPFYWGRYEPVEGQPDEEKTMRAAKWAQANGLTTKGHPLCWHTVCADWLLQYDSDTILKKQMDRIRRDVSLYAGVIDMWDVINEVVIMPRFDRYDNAVSRIVKDIGAIELTLQCFKAARESNPNATLLLNDFDLSEDYKQLITELLDRGCPIDVIGLQSHQHTGYDGVELTLEFIDRFEGFGLPLHFTEITILSGEQAPKVADLNDLHIENWASTPEYEEQQRQRVEEYYSAIFSRPSTGGMVWWDLVDGGWLGAPAGLLRRDLSEKPAFKQLEKMIKGDWWLSSREIPVESDGTIRFSGTAGTYKVTVDGRSTEVTLNSESKTAAV